MILLECPMKYAMFDFLYTSLIYCTHCNTIFKLMSYLLSFATVAHSVTSTLCSKQYSLRIVLPQKNITLIVCLMYIVSAFVKIYITVKLVDARSCIIAAVFTNRENVKFLLT